MGKTFFQLTDILSIFRAGVKYAGRLRIQLRPVGLVDGDFLGRNLIALGQVGNLVVLRLFSSRRSVSDLRSSSDRLSAAREDCIPAITSDRDSIKTFWFSFSTGWALG